MTTLHDCSQATRMNQLAFPTTAEAQCVRSDLPRHARSISAPSFLGAEPPTVTHVLSTQRIVNGNILHVSIPSLEPREYMTFERVRWSVNTVQ
jgi:hypothetical protein